MEIHECPRFSRCSAPICPLDKQYLESAHQDGEPVCVYLREYVKPGGSAVLRGVISEEHAQAVEQAYPKIIARYAPVKKALKRASATGSKLGKPIPKLNYEKRIDSNNRDARITTST